MDNAKVQTQSFRQVQREGARSPVPDRHGLAHTHPRTRGPAPSPGGVGLTVEGAKPFEDPSVSRFDLNYRAVSPHLLCRCDRLMVQVVKSRSDRIAPDQVLNQARLFEIAGGKFWAI